MGPGSKADLLIARSCLYLCPKSRLFTKCFKDQLQTQHTACCLDKRFVGLQKKKAGPVDAYRLVVKALATYQVK